MSQEDEQKQGFLGPDNEDQKEVTPITLSTRSLQKIVFHAIFTEVASSTRKEIRGLIQGPFIEELQIKRGLLKSLAVNLGYDKKMIPEEWMGLGIDDFIPEDILQYWANLQEPPLGMERSLIEQAKLILNKRQAKETGNQ